MRSGGVPLTSLGVRKCWIMEATRLAQGYLQIVPQGPEAETLREGEEDYP